MTTEEAIFWCKNRGIEITFASTSRPNSIELHCPHRGRIDGESLVEAVNKVREENKPDHFPLDETPLELLSFAGRNCRGRLIRAARALQATTVSELLDWAERQPQGLKQITSLHNVGETSYRVLVEALENHGVNEIPYADSPRAA